MNRTLEMGDVARNKLTMPDSYLAEDLREEQLIEIKGMVLGYSEGSTWSGVSSLRYKNSIKTGR
jgi:uncharacterized protein